MKFLKVKFNIINNLISKPRCLIRRTIAAASIFLLQKILTHFYEWSVATDQKPQKLKINIKCRLLRNGLKNPQKQLIIPIIKLFETIFRNRILNKYEWIEEPWNFSACRSLRRPHFFRRKLMIKCTDKGWTIECIFVNDEKVCDNVSRSYFRKVFKIANLKEKLIVNIKAIYFRTRDVVEGIRWYSPYALWVF